ncbi:MAG: radical SAM protein [Candidatus Gastranaerophilaceae bacterium]|jgi:MoaA/NifB/PqqE/SkfB family radical SAM enzyme
MELIYQAPCVQLNKLENIWFQLSNMSCNLKCRHCYLGCAPNNKKKNFLQSDKVRKYLEENNNNDLKSIYLTGGEPMVHPDFNNIVRLCLKKANVTVLTNGTLINDKKARFLRQIEDSYDYELIFRISIDHFTEGRNDEIRGKGSFKKAIAGIINLLKNGFNPIISCVNIKNEDEEILKNGFRELFKKYDFEIEDINLKIIPLLKIGEYAKFHIGYDDKSIVKQEDLQRLGNDVLNYLDCASSRVIAADGIYCCPALVGDPRGKLGNNIAESPSKVYLETGPCYTCISNKQKLFCNNW